MTSPIAGPKDEISMFEIATIVIRNRRRIVLLAIAGGLIAFAAVFAKPRLYTASFAFVPQGTDPVGSGLASLAGQFGLAAPSAGGPQQPEFYLTLLRSRELLGPIVLDTFAVAEEGGKRVPLLDLLEIGNLSPAARKEAGIRKMQTLLSASPVKNAGIVRVGIKTEWPSVSHQISELLLEGVNEFNVRARQSQAATERKFVEGLLASARDSLRSAEDRLQRFLTGNRGGVNTSPHLSSEWQRLERDVAAKSAMVSSLTQEYSDVRIREVRDTPVITLFESPAVSTIPEARGRLGTMLMGVFLGGSLGLALALLGAVLAKRRAGRDPDADAFFDALDEVKPKALRRLRPATQRD